MRLRNERLVYFALPGEARYQRSDSLHRFVDRNPWVALLLLIPCSQPAFVLYGIEIGEITAGQEVQEFLVVMQVLGVLITMGALRCSRRLEFDESIGRMTLRSRHYFKTRSVTRSEGQLLVRVVHSWIWIDRTMKVSGMSGYLACVVVNDLLFPLAWSNTEEGAVDRVSRLLVDCPIPAQP